MASNALIEQESKVTQTSLNTMLDASRTTPAAPSESELLSLSLLDGLAKGNTALAGIVEELKIEESKWLLPAANLIRNNPQVKTTLGGYNLPNVVRLAGLMKYKSQEQFLDEAVKQAIQDAQNSDARYKGRYSNEYAPAKSVFTNDASAPANTGSSSNE